jgi:hypothetical protein
MRLAAVICLLLLAGCGADRATRNSPDFKAGYSDGCASADLQGANPRDTGLARDEEAWRANTAYHSGWGEGFSACRAMAAPQGNGPLAMPRGP